MSTTTIAAISRAKFDLLRCDINLPDQDCVLWKKLRPYGLETD